MRWKLYAYCTLVSVSPIIASLAVAVPVFVYLCWLWYSGAEFVYRHALVSLWVGFVLGLAVVVINDRILKYLLKLFLKEKANETK